MRKIKIILPDAGLTLDELLFLNYNSISVNYLIENRNKIVTDNNIEIGFIPKSCYEEIEEDEPETAGMWLHKTFMGKSSNFTLIGMMLAYDAGFAECEKRHKAKKTLGQLLEENKREN